MKTKKEIKIKKAKPKYPEKDWLSPKIEFRSSPTHGKGMFAKKPIKKGEVVMMWGGPYIVKSEVQKAKEAGKLVIQLDENLFSVDERGECITYFINHSCDPNVWMDDAVKFSARRNISKDEELTIDYMLFEDDENKIASWDCDCASKLCRKKITGKDWRLPELQKKYNSHFSPLINKKIERLNKGKP